jgi:hypothetical protein
MLYIQLQFGFKGLQEQKYIYIYIHSRFYRNLDNYDFTDDSEVCTASIISAMNVDASTINQPTESLTKAGVKAQA